MIDSERATQCTDKTSCGMLEQLRDALDEEM